MESDEEIKNYLSDQVAQLREVFKENPPLCYGWDHDPGVQDNVDYALAKLLSGDGGL